MACTHKGSISGQAFLDSLSMTGRYIYGNKRTNDATIRTPGSLWKATSPVSTNDIPEFVVTEVAWNTPALRRLDGSCFKLSSSPGGMNVFPLTSKEAMVLLLRKYDAIDQPT
jgi:hypothetical protein